MSAVICEQLEGILSPVTLREALQNVSGGHVWALHFFTLLAALQYPHLALDWKNCSVLRWTGQIRT